jgi:hypothetical protein
MQAASRKVGGMLDLLRQIPSITGDPQSDVSTSNRERLTSEIVDDVQCAYASAITKRIVNEIQWRDRV